MLLYNLAFRREWEFYYTLRIEIDKFFSIIVSVRIEIEREGEEWVRSSQSLVSVMSKRFHSRQ